MKDEQWYWPIRLLKVLARLPFSSDTWLTGHTIDHQNPFSEIRISVLRFWSDFKTLGKDSYLCQLRNGETVNFYQVIPLYREELEYKLEHGAYALIEQMEEVDFIVYPSIVPTA